jgi:hypothetical protein
LFVEGARERISVLHGFTQLGRCTLCDLIESDRSGLTDYGLAEAINSKTYRASLCITGMHLNGSQDRCLNSARYIFTGRLAPESRHYKMGEGSGNHNNPFKGP